MGGGGVCVGGECGGVGVWLSLCVGCVWGCVGVDVGVSGSGRGDLGGSPCMDECIIVHKRACSLSMIGKCCLC